jgi:hypothetical protein
MKYLQHKIKRMNINPEQLLKDRDAGVSSEERKSSLSVYNILAYDEYPCQVSLYVLVCLGISNGFFPQIFTTKIWFQFLISSMCAASYISLCLTGVFLTIRHICQFRIQTAVSSRTRFRCVKERYQIWECYDWEDSYYGLLGYDTVWSDTFGCRLTTYATYDHKKYK